LWKDVLDGDHLVIVAGLALREGRIQSEQDRPRDAGHEIEVAVKYFDNPLALLIR
jgi:hypothetical protein